MNPTRWEKLLLDQETSRSFDRMLLEKHNTGQAITIDIMVNVLYDLLSSRRSMKSCHKSLFQMYNKPGLMGREGDCLDTFVSQLNRDMAACKMESFRWTDFLVLIMINTLRSSDKNEEKLAESLNHLYDVAESKKKVLDITMMQAEV